MLTSVPTQLPDGSGTKTEQLIAEYLWIGGQHMDAKTAARRMGVHVRTIERWRAKLNAAQSTAA